MEGGSPTQFFLAFMIAPMVAMALLLLWWLLASRLPWRERGLVLIVLLAAAGVTALVSRETFPPMALILYGIPATATAWVGYLALTGWLNWPVRRTGLLVLLVLVWGTMGMLRIEGMNGNFAAKFNWRWTPTAEEKLIAELSTAPAAKSAAPAKADVKPLELGPGDWPGFRGAERDGRLTGVRIATDWDQSPPRELWRRRIGPGWSSFAVIGERAFTQEQRGEDELVVCYDMKSGAELWKHADETRFTETIAGPGPRATPTFQDGWLYAQGASGKLNCLDAATGAVRWSRDVAADSGAKVPIWGFSSSPLFVQGVVTVFAGGPEGKSVLGYKADTGELAWSTGQGILSYSSTQLAHIDDVDQLLIATDTGLSALDPRSGKVLWTHDWPVDNIARIVQPTLLGSGDVLIGTGMGVGTRRINVSRQGDAWQTKELWTSKAIKPYFNDLVVQNDHLYGIDGQIFMCVSLADGKIAWRTRGYGTGQVLLIADQNLLLILSEEGDVALVAAQPQAYKEVAKFKAIEGKTWNHPVIAHGKLLVRNGEEVACFELKPERATQTAQAAAN